jgi:ASC-1-like (ASCH) protein
LRIILNAYIMKWKDKLLNVLYDELKDEEDWSAIVDNAINKHQINIHLAIFTEPFLTLLFEGKKTVESRLSNNKIIPFGKVHVGDVILVKRSGGPVEGVFLAKEVTSIRGVGNIKKLLSQKSFQESVCIDIETEFAQNKVASNYATLISVSALKKINPIDIGKSDRAGWSIIKLGFNQTLFNNVYE